MDAILGSSAAGPEVVCAPALEIVPSKWKANANYVKARMDILAKMLQEHGLDPKSGLSADRVSAFLKSSGGSTHSSADVREATKRCAEELNKIVEAEERARAEADGEAKLRELMRLHLAGIRNVDELPLPDELSAEDKYKK